MLDIGVLNLSGLVGVLVFLWYIHRDIAALRERMARIEGLFEGFTGRRDTPPSVSQ